MGGAERYKSNGSGGWASVLMELSSPSECSSLDWPTDTTGYVFNPL